MFTKILIANRGEIACRVIETAQRMGIHCVAVYSEADTHSLHVAMADEAYCIGAAPSKESYLQGQRIIDVAIKSGAQAIHPGYGFLSENADFARLCSANNITFIAPPVKAIDAMGSKSAAKQIMEAAQVPLVPGYHGDDQNPELIRQASEKIKYPVLLKAAAGGGGKGMRVVWAPEEFDEALAAAKREANNAFGDDKMLVEKYLTKPRHVEIQVFVDQQGEGVYLFERDCSIQRRHQKVIEEAPAPGISDQLRQQMGESALKAAQAIDYEGAGTVEFLLNEDGQFYFMEMNTRLQVEHPVTEMITGLDLVEWQLLIASGKPLPLKQDQLRINGHAFEVRIYAEDPDNDFLPSTGTIDFLQTPETNSNVRIDTGVRQGDEVSVYYDPMIAKVITWGETRASALSQMARTLNKYRLVGPKTNLNLLQDLVAHPSFQSADFDTSFIEKHRDSLFSKNDDQHLNEVMAIAACYKIQRHQKPNTTQDAYSPWLQSDAWSCIDKGRWPLEFSMGDNQYSLAVTTDGLTHKIKIDDTELKLSVTFANDNNVSVTINNAKHEATVVAIDNQYTIYFKGHKYELTLIEPDLGVMEENNHSGYSAPMNGTLISVLIEKGSSVIEGQTLVIMEAMKMEHSIKAHADGIVQAVFFNEGELLSEGDIMIQLEEPQI
jgi:3-methylcrotonyl-CoA carboxylase alpha subunit